MWLSCSSESSIGMLACCTCCLFVLVFRRANPELYLLKPFRPDSRSRSSSSYSNGSVESGSHALSTAHTAVPSEAVVSPPAPAASRTPRTSINDFELLAVIGRGGYGKVGAAGASTGI